MSNQKPLDTPTKRIGALILFAGVIFLAFGLSRFMGTYRALESAAIAFERGPFWAVRNLGERTDALGGFFLWLGTSLAIGGLLCSYLYEQTVGRAVRWVRTGSVARDANPTMRPFATASYAKRPTRPKSPFFKAIGPMMVVLLSSWLTAIISSVFGVIYFQGKDLELLLAPAGIAGFFWLKSLIQSAFNNQVSSPRTASVLLGTKMLVAYLFFGLGLLVATFELVR